MSTPKVDGVPSAVGLVIIANRLLQLDSERT
jgi:hypothetical protein